MANTKTLAVSIAVIIVAVVGILIFLQNPMSPNNNNIAGINQSPSIPASFSITQCVDKPTITILRTVGFESVKPRTSGTHPLKNGTMLTPGYLLGIYEFVVKPQSQSKATFLYDFCPNGQVSANTSSLSSTALGNIFDSYNTTNYHDFAKFLDKPVVNTSQNGGFALSNDNANPYLYPVSSSNMSGLVIYASNLTMKNDHSVAVTYTFDGTASKPSQYPETYRIELFASCPAEIVTIGDGPNNRSMAIDWANQTWYGC